jgi:hypothetical protein
MQNAREVKRPPSDMVEQASVKKVRIELADTAPKDKTATAASKSTASSNSKNSDEYSEATCLC